MVSGEIVRIMPGKGQALWICEVSCSFGPRVVVLCVVEKGIRDESQRNAGGKRKHALDHVLVLPQCRP